MLIQLFEEGVLTVVGEDCPSDGATLFSGYPGQGEEELRLNLMSFFASEIGQTEKGVGFSQKVGFEDADHGGTEVWVGVVEGCFHDVGLDGIEPLERPEGVESGQGIFVSEEKFSESWNDGAVVF